MKIINNVPTIDEILVKIEQGDLKIGKTIYHSEVPVNSDEPIIICTRYGYAIKYPSATGSETVFFNWTKEGLHG